MPEVAITLSITACVLIVVLATAIGNITVDLRRLAATVETLRGALTVADEADDWKRGLSRDVDGADERRTP